MSVKIIGIDPGNYKTGVAVAEIKGNNFNLLFSTVISSKKRPQNLQNIFNSLKEIIEEFKPQEISLESSFFGKNIQSLIRLGEVRGIILLLSSIYDLKLYEYTPQKVKNAMTGYGWADKNQVIEMVKYICGVEVKSQDEADAIAVTFCHWINRKNI